MCHDVRSALGTIFSGLFTVHDPTRGSGHSIFHNLTGRLGSARVGSGCFQTTGRLGSYLKKKYHGSGRVGSGEEVGKLSRVGSVQV